MEFTAGLPFLERMTYKQDDIVILNSGIWCNDPLDFREQVRAWNLFNGRHLFQPDSII